ncbi:MAG: alpha/beta fold hydrolase [Pseudomonadales bacterium]
MPMLQREACRIFYEVAGDGPTTLLLTHGYSATSYMWRGIVEALKDRYRLITWDIRGHGRSDSPSDPAAYSKALALGDMLALIDAAGADRAILMGHSLGGYLSLSFHVEHPDRVGGLILVGTGPGYRNPEARTGWNDQAEGRAKFFETNGIDNLELAEAHGKQHRSAEGLALAARGILAQHDGLVMENLTRIAVPTLIVVGADDKPFLGASDYMAKRIPGAQLVTLPDAGHIPNIDQPAAFEAAVGGFLARVAA